MRSFEERLDFKTLLLQDRDIAGALGTDGIEKAFNLEQQLRHVDVIFERVFQEVTA